MEPCTIKDETPRGELDITVTLHVTSKDELFYLRELFNLNPKKVAYGVNDDGPHFSGDEVRRFSWSVWEELKYACKRYID